MLRFHIPPAVPFLAIFLVLCIIGIRDNGDKVNYQSRHHFDRADDPLLAYRDSHPRGMKTFRSHTGTSPTPPISTGSSCYNPPLSVPFTDVDLDQLCQCESYDYSQYYNSGWYEGKTRCQATCVPRYSNQTRIVDANESYSKCLGSCAGSFEKAKRAMAEGKRQSEEYWFCHGVNFIKDELCEFIGAIEYYKYPTPGVQCWDNGLSGTGAA